MADSDFLDDSNKLFGALGSQSVKMVEKKQAKEEKSGESSMSETLEYLRSFYGSSSVGKKPMEEDTKLLTQILQNLNTKVELFLGKAIQSISPVVRTELSNIATLLDTGSKTDEALAMQKLEELQKKFSADLKLFNQNLGKNFTTLSEKLSQAAQTLKEATEKKIEEAKNTQSQLLEKGIRTTVDTSTGNLKYLSPQEIQKRQDDYIRTEQIIKIEENKLLNRLKAPGAGEKGEYNQQQQEEIKIIKETIDKRQKELQIIKSEIGEKAGRKQGTLESAFRQSFGLVKDLFGGFALDVKNIGGLFTGLGKNLKGTSGNVSEFGQTTTELNKDSKEYSSVLQKGILPSLKKLADSLLLLLKEMTSKLLKGVSGLLNVVGLKGAGASVGKFASRLGGAGASVGGAAIAGEGAGIAAGAAGAGAGLAAGGTAAAAGTAGAAAGGAGLLAFLPEILAVLAVVGIGAGLFSLFKDGNKEAAKENLDNPNVDAMGNPVGPSAAIKPLEEKTFTKPGQINSKELSSLSTQNAGQQNTPNNVVVAPQQNTVANMTNATTVTSPMPFNTEASYRNLSTTVW
jgi:hypothetical protein